MRSPNVKPLCVPPRFLRYPLWGALVAALGACASLAPREVESPTADVPAAWTSRAGGGVVDPASLARWWERFDDPTLGRLVEQALAANNSVGAAQATVRQAQALRDVAAAAMVPSLGGSASVSRSAGGTSAGGRAGTTSTQAGLSGDWTPDVSGGGRHALAAGQAVADASVASLGDMRVQVACEVGLSYIALRAAQARWDIAKANLASQLETLQITLWRQQAGLVTELDAAQARTAVEQTRALLPTLRTTIEQNGHALWVLMNRPPNDPWPSTAAMLAGSSAIPSAADGLELQIPAETLRQRADVRASEYQVAAALARVQQADAARWPSFSISGTLGYGAASLGLLGGGATLASTLLAGVTLPLFDGGAARAQVRVQQAALDLARISYRTAVLTALQEVEDELGALRNDRVRLSSLDEAATEAGQAAELARQRYGSGLIDFQAVLATQRAQLTTQDASAQAGADVSADQVRLFKALGGGWQADDAATNETPSEDRHPAAASRTPRP